MREGRSETWHNNEKLLLYRLQLKQEFKESFKGVKPWLCRKTKTKVIILVNHKGQGQNSEPIKTEKVVTCS